MDRALDYRSTVEGRSSSAGVIDPSFVLLAFDAQPRKVILVFFLLCFPSNPVGFPFNLPTDVVRFWRHARDPHRSRSYETAENKPWLEFVQEEGFNALGSLPRLLWWTFTFVHHWQSRTRSRQGFQSFTVKESAFKGFLPLFFAFYSLT